MASLVRRSRRRGGVPCDFWAVEYVCPRDPAKRRTLYVGFTSQRDAQRHHQLIEDICDRWNPAIGLPNALVAQVRQLAPAVQTKYERLGLLPEIRGPRKLGDLTKAFLGQRKLEEGTARIYKRTIERLHEYLGEDSDISGIRPEHAHGWKAWLFTAAATNRARPLVEATVAKHVAQAKSIFQWAVSLEWLDRTPFRGVVNGSQVNERRMVRVSGDVIERVIAKSTDPELRALIGLGRYGGLRLPSEAVDLSWRDVDLRRNVLNVYAPKTKRARQLPICRRLGELLRELRAASDGGDTPLFPELRRDTNLRTPLLRLIERAELTRWPRLWQNLRLSRVNDWLDAKHDLWDIADWMGHSPEVLLQHYRRGSGDALIRATQE